MSRTLDETLAALDNLTGSWKTLGHAVQYKLQAVAMAELREHLTAPVVSSDERRSRSDRRRRNQPPDATMRPPPPPPPDKD